MNKSNEPRMDDMNAMDACINAGTCKQGGRMNGCLGKREQRNRAKRKPASGTLNRTLFTEKHTHSTCAGRKPGLQVAILY